MKDFKPIVDKPLVLAPGSDGTPPGADPRAPLEIDTTIEGYRIERLIGQGSFSLVYNALDLKTQRRVVIKEYFPKHFAHRDSQQNVVPADGDKLMAFHEGLRKFQVEALTLRKVAHPGVLNTRNFFSANRTAYLISDNGQGRDLLWFLRSIKKPLDEKMLIKVYMPVLSALNHLHGSNMLHLDIKPANILLQSDGRPVLLDFGATQPMHSRKRINGRQILTHGFAPPEQYDKNRALGPWTDIYAVAASIYYCISGRPPARSKNNPISSRLDERRYPGRYSAKLLEAVNRGLSHDESNRHSNIDDFAADLLQGGSPWSTLEEYERHEMDYHRDANNAPELQEFFAKYAA